MQSGGVGAVALAAGYGAFAQPTRAAATVATLGRIGEAFLDGQPDWRIRRLAPTEAETPSRVGLRRAIDGVVTTDGPCVLIVVGAVVSTALGPAIACAAELGAYPEDTTLPLAWIGERLKQYRGDSLVVALVAEGDDRDRRRWLAELAGPPCALVAVTSATADALEALLEGLWGDAIDHATGTVTARSLGEHLARRLTTAAIHPSTSDVALVTPPVVARRHDPRLSRLLASTATTESAADLIGQILSGRFRVAAELGRGGFGVVYRAHHDLLKLDFAIKVLTLGDAASREDAELFLQEIRALAALVHRNVVRIHFADVLGRRRMFFAMELIEGLDLQRILDDEGALSPARVLALGTQLLAGLGAAHAAGLVHADVKPANLLVVVEGESERLVLVDFGLARLRGTEPVRAVGGTTFFMSPEQRRDGVVDARSDLFAAGRVLLAMLIGRVEDEIRLDAVVDPNMRAVLTRALADEPSDRFASAAEMAAAMHGKPFEASSIAPRPPFRHAAPFIEIDRDDFHGRDREIATLLDATLFRRCVVYAAPSGTGKTSLLRAGLVPRLVELGIRTSYVACRAGSTVDVAGSIGSDGGRQVLILDQLEVMLLAGSQATAVLFTQVRELVRTSSTQVTIVLSVREEFLARVLEQTAELTPGPPLRLGPLTTEEARRAIVLTLHARRLVMSPDLLDALMSDLQESARRMPAQLGWGDVPAVYPPHLQLVGAVLYETLPTSATTFTLENYRRLGGLSRIVGEHLHRVLDGELTPKRTSIARAILLALVATTHTRESIAETDLLAIERNVATRDEVLEVIGFLRDRGLVVALAGVGGTIWELAHDSLVPRIEAWVTASDLARLRALELIRHHLRRSDSGTPSLLDVRELREISRCTKVADLAELDSEWSGRLDLADGGRTRSGTDLVALSRRAVRARRVAVLSAFAIACGIVGLLAVRWQSERAQRDHEAMLRDRDIGSFTIVLSAFDWDPTRQAPVDVALTELPNLDWTLHKPDPIDVDEAGDPYPPADVIEHTTVTHDARIHQLSARGGAAVIVIRGRGRRVDGAVERCSDAIVPVRRLPGYSAPAPAPTYLLRIPTCGATRAGAIAIPGGEFIAGGAGDPIVSYAAELPPEQIVTLAPYAIDRTEVTNATFAVFTSMSKLHGVLMPDYPDTTELRNAGGPDYPVSFINWPEARAYCRFLGKDLPTLDQWDRALRGGVMVSGVPNPAPRRNFAWPGAFVVGAAAVPDVPSNYHPFAVGRFSKDTSPDGIADLTGNLQEWILAAPPTNAAGIVASREAARAAAWAPSGRFRITRGCNWSDRECGRAAGAADFAALPNQRAYDMRNFMLGFRCASTNR